MAVKSMVLPIKMSGAEKRGRLAVMEAAISASLSHPNIIKTFTYTLTPVRVATHSTPSSLGPSVSASADSEGLQATQQSSRITSSDFKTPGSNQTTLPSSLKQTPVSAFEVQLVLELCDLGTLQGALELQAFHGQSGLGN